VSTIIVTGHTPDYKGRALALVKSAKECGQKIRRYEYADRGCWMANTRGKAAVMCRARDDYPEYALMWSDADNVLHRPFPKTDWEEKYDFVGPLVRYKRPRKFFVSSLWFNNTVAGDMMLNEWLAGCEWDQREPGMSDEFWLEEARRKLEDEVRWGIMPQEWAWLPKDGPPDDTAVMVVGISGMAPKGHIVQRKRFKEHDGSGYCLLCGVDIPNNPGSEKCYKCHKEGEK